MRGPELYAQDNYCKNVEGSRVKGSNSFLKPMSTYPLFPSEQYSCLPSLPLQSGLIFIFPSLDIQFFVAIIFLWLCSLNCCLPSVKLVIQYTQNVIPDFFSLLFSLFLFLLIMLEYRHYFPRNCTTTLTAFRLCVGLTFSLIFGATHAD